MARFLAAGVLFVCASGPQVLPPARDGDIRTVYWALRDETEVWLTLEPRSADGAAAPPSMIVTFSRSFAGKRPAAPATDDTPIDVRAYAGMLWNPRPELSFVVDGIALTPRLVVPHIAGAAPGLVPGTASDYLPGTVTLVDLKRLGAAQRVSGNALGFQFVLSDTQRDALRRFAVRATSSDPAAG